MFEQGKRYSVSLVDVNELLDAVCESYDSEKGLIKFKNDSGAVFIVSTHSGFKFARQIIH